MSEQIADNFIADLSSMLKSYQDKSAKSRELEELVDMSGHMVAALGAIRSKQVMRKSNLDQPMTH